MKITSEKRFLNRVEELVGFSLSPAQTDVALNVLSDAKAKASFDIAEAEERAEKEAIKSNYRRLLKTSNRVVKG